MGSCVVWSVSRKCFVKSKINGDWGIWNEKSGI